MDNYMELILRVKKENKDEIMAELYDLGVDGIEVQEAYTEEEMELIDGDYIEIQQRDIPRDEAILKAYIKVSTFEENAAFFKAFSMESIEAVTDHSYLTEYKKYFYITPLGKHFVIVPAWEIYQPKGEEKIINIDPGIAFGTGTHATTKNVLRLMENFDFKDKAVTDVGCGSGILSIGALKLGAKKVDLYDIDEQAIKTAGENIALNHLDENQEISLQVNSLLEGIEVQYDCILANIVADIITIFAESAYEHLNFNGLFFTSGIIKEKWSDTNKSVINSGFELLELIEEDGWCSAVYQKV